MKEALTVLACPSEEIVVAFALGKLDESQRVAFEEHLDLCARCQVATASAAHLDPPAAAVTLPVDGSGELDWNTTFPRGALVGGRYEIRRFVARGAMGEVYEAFDRVLGERVALKTVTSTASDDARAVRRLKAEVQLARLVSHPNVCRIYDLGMHALPGPRAELPFLTMQFVVGETLGQRVRLAGALPFPEATKLARELLLALRAAHDAGVLHRDFKSDNVMLTATPNGASSAVVLDFGLARGLARGTAQSASNSNVVGTVGYIAPEQFEGKGCSIASDLFSFGVVWYEMLTGEMPFEAASSPRVTPSRPILVKLPGPVPAPSSLNSAVPKALDAVVLRCLERAPERRFKSVDALLDAIDDAMEGPVLRRRRMLFAASFVAVAAVAASAYLVERSAPGILSRDLAAVDTTSTVRVVAPPRVVVPSPTELPPSAVVPQPHAVAPSRAMVPSPHAVVPSPREPPPRVLVRADEPAGPSASPPTFGAVRPGVPGVSSAPRPTAPGTAPPVAAVTSGVTPSPNGAPREASTAAGPRAPVKDPDWEDPFSGVERPELVAGSKSPN